MAKITTVGIDEAHYLAISEKRSRILAFPDRKARHITLKNWHWEVFDKLQTEKGWLKGELLAAALQVAARHHPERGAEFEECLRWGVSFLINLNMAYVMKGDGDWTVSNNFGDYLP